MSTADPNMLPDFAFFEANPGRRFRIRPTVPDDIWFPGEDEPRVPAGSQTVLQLMGEDERMGDGDGPELSQFTIVTGQVVNDSDGAIEALLRDHGKMPRTLRPGPAHPGATLLGSVNKDRVYNGDVIAEDLRDRYGIEPFILSDGSFGVHFMDLSSSLDFGGTLVEHIALDIAARRSGSGKLDLNAASALRSWQEMLLAALAVVEAAQVEVTP